MTKRRLILGPEGQYPMPGNPCLEKAEELDVKIMLLAHSENLTEAEAWETYNNLKVK